MASLRHAQGLFGKAMEMERLGRAAEALTA